MTGFGRRGSEVFHTAKNSVSGRGAATHDNRLTAPSRSFRGCSQSLNFKKIAPRRNRTAPMRINAFNWPGVSAIRESPAGGCVGSRSGGYEHESQTAA